MKHATLLQPILEQLAETADVTWAPGYAEPGYSGDVVFLANWNPSKFDGSARREPLPRLAKVLEACGAGVEWSDEWTTCCDCGKAVRTSPDSYSWLPSYVISRGGDVVCRGCLDGGDYLSEIANDPRKACMPYVDPAEFGWERLPGKYENGFHPGQTDEPAKVLAMLRAEHPGKEFVFQVSGKGQFDVVFEVWARTSE